MCHQMNINKRNELYKENGACFSAACAYGMKYTGV